VTLMLTRRAGQCIAIGDIVIKVVRVHDSGKVRIAIDAPPGTLVLRAELLDADPDADAPPKAPPDAATE
jgi:carbon storage regulator CsrA